MMKLFDEMPYLESDVLVMKEMTQEDAPALQAIASDPKVYVYLPTFLYEQKYADAHEVIAKMRQECFQTGESIMLGIFLKDDLHTMVGIAEFYAYDERKRKVSIGIRLARAYWHKGIALSAEQLMMEYLKNCGIRTVTGHIMHHNGASAAIVRKIGFDNKYPLLWEDWGREGPVLTDKYVYRFY